MDYRYKLITRDGQTRPGLPGETTWRIGHTVHALGDPDQDLCSDGWLHCYDSPELAVLLNPIHAAITDPRMMIVQCGGESRDDHGLKRGYRSMKPILYMDCPEATTEIYVRFTILCALKVYQAPAFRTWAADWLSGKDRSEAAAREAAEAAEDAEAAEAAEAARAARAAWGATRAAEAADAAESADARAAREAAEAADAAARATREAADALAADAALAAAGFAALAADAWTADAALAAAAAAAEAAWEAELDLVAIAEQAFYGEG